MNTRCYISVLNNDNSVDTVYCHENGAVKGVGKLLVKHYNTDEKVRKLLAKGALKSLGQTLSKCEFYEEPGPARFYTWDTANEIASDYHYLFDPRRVLWLCRLSGGTECHDLSLLVK